jgi:hypothetical protein
MILPLPSRFDGRTEVEDAKGWLRRFAVEMSEYYIDWLPANTDVSRVVERTKVPHIAKFSFGEKLPVLTESLTDPEGMGYVYSAVADLLANDFRTADETLLGEKATGSAQDLMQDLEDLTLDLERDMSAQRARSRITLFISWLGGVVLAGAAAAVFILDSGLSLISLVAILFGFLGGFLSVFQSSTRRLRESQSLESLRRDLQQARVLYARDRERFISAYEDVLKRYRELNVSNMSRTKA